MEERQRVTRGREAESDQKKREREWPVEKRYSSQRKKQTVSKGRAVESDQRKRDKEWPEAVRGQRNETESGHRKRVREWPVEKRQRLARGKKGREGPE